jgi:hypothetical protein
METKESRNKSTSQTPAETRSQVQMKSSPTMADPKEPKAEAAARVGTLLLSTRKGSFQKSPTQNGKSNKETATTNGARNMSRKILYSELSINFNRTTS